MEERRRRRRRRRREMSDNGNRRVEFNGMARSLTNGWY
jgi:hypothetical protein